MKCEVKIKWRDIKTGELHKVGEIVEVTKTRYNQVCKVNPNVLVEVVEDAEPEDDE